MQLLVGCHVVLDVAVRGKFISLGEVYLDTGDTSMSF